jgi:serine/threonine-protein kinase
MLTGPPPKFHGTWDILYAAPEQLMGEDIDGRADQYALAATAYHLLTGSQLFPNTNPAVVISRHLNASPLPCRNIDLT